MPKRRNLLCRWCRQSFEVLSCDVEQLSHEFKLMGVNPVCTIPQLANDLLALGDFGLNQQEQCIGPRDFQQQRLGIIRPLATALGNCGCAKEKDGKERPKIGSATLNPTCKNSTIRTVNSRLGHVALAGMLNGCAELGVVLGVWPASLDSCRDFPKMERCAY